MPLSDLTLTTQLGWTLAAALTGFQDRTQGPDSQTFTLVGIDLTVFTELLASNYSIANTAHQDFDLFSFTDLDLTATGFGTHGVISLLILPTVGDVVLSPGGANPLGWPLTGTAPTMTLKAGGAYLFSYPASAAAGFTVDATHRNLTLTNNSGVTATGYFLAIGG